MKYENHKCSGSGGNLPTVLNGDETTNYQNCKDFCDSEPDCVGFVRNEFQKCYFKNEDCLTNIEAYTN